jgi:cell division protein FtsA
VGGSGRGSTAGKRIVLSGGASQLAGAPEAVRRILGGQVRLARPLALEGLPEAAASPAFAVAAGLLVYPQVAAREHFYSPGAEIRATGTDGYFTRVGRWLKDSF